MSQNENSHSIAPPEPGSAWMNSHHLVSILMQHLPACIFIKNTSGHYIAANTPMVEILGFAHAGELIGKTDHDIFTGEKARANRLDEERVMQTGQPITDRVEYIERAARSFWCSMTKVPLRDDTGAITGVIGIGRDISDHVQNEKRERTSTQDLKAVVEIADRLISSPDLDTLLRKAVELARSLLRVERCSILLNREDHLIGTYGTDLNGRTTDERDKIIPMDAAWENRFRMWDRKTSQWIVERDIQRSSPDARTSQARNFWVATTPIKGTQNRMIGVFCNDSVISGQAPDEHLQDVIAVFCSLLGNIIERQRSMDDIRSRDQVLDGVARSSSQLLLVDDIDPAIQESLRLLGESMNVDRACIYKNRQDVLTGEWQMGQRYEWTQHPAQPSISDERLQDLPYLPDFQEMFEHLSNGRIFDGETARLPPAPRRLFESLQIVSFLRVPIQINNRFWGFIGFDDAQANRNWSANEKTILLAMAGNLGGAISRELTERELKSRDRILSGVAKANHELLTNPDVELAIAHALRTLAPSVNADRIFLCENQAGSHRDQTVMMPRHLFTKSTGLHRSFAAREICLPYREFFPRWFDIMTAGRMISGRMLEFISEEAGNVNSVLMAPLIVEKKFWGVIGFDSADAGYVWTESDVSTLSTIAGSISAAIARHRAEESLRRSEEHFRSLIENTSDLIMMVDSRGDVLYGSPSVSRELGFLAGQDARFNFFEMIHAEDWTHLRALFNAAAGTPVDDRLFTFRVRHQDGEWRTVECAFRRIRDENGATRFIVNARDITARIRTEEALHRSEELLRHSQKMEAVGRLAGGVAHDFNNLLTAILGYSDLLIDQIPDGHAWKREIVEISRAAERAHSLTKQLLAYSRRQVMESKTVDLNHIVAETERMLNRLISENVAVQTTLDPDPCTVKVDRGQIEQVIINLSLNARDAMPEGGELRISTANVSLTHPINQGMTTVPPGDYVLLKIRDTGHGIPDDVKPHVFEPFFTTKEVGKGTGLGLSMVYGIIEQSSAHILLESTVGTGTEFSVYLPRVSAGETVPGIAPPPSTAGGSEQILLIEDDKIVRELSTRILEGKGYRVTTRENGALGLDYFTQHADEIDIVLTDIIMPQMSGLTFARAARRIKPDLRILFISGYAEDHQPESHETSNGRNYIQKPFTVSTLCGKVREILDSPVTAITPT